MYDDFYNEPSEFELQVDEFKQGLMNAVKDEYKAEMESLRKENEELQEVKKRMKDIEFERRQEKNEVERIRREAVNEAKKSRLDSLLEGLRHTIYTVEYEREHMPKCDKCDENRLLEYKTPLGRVTKEECLCKKTTKTHFVKDLSAVRINLNSQGDMFVTGFYDEFRDESIRPIDIMGNDVKNEDVREWKPYFDTKERAESYCEWANKNRR
jgi:hypothetical protein